MSAAVPDSGGFMSMLLDWARYWVQGWSQQPTQVVLLQDGISGGQMASMGGPPGRGQFHPLIERPSFAKGTRKKIILQVTPKGDIMSYGEEFQAFSEIAIFVYYSCDEYSWEGAKNEGDYFSQEQELTSSVAGERIPSSCFLHTGSFRTLRGLNSSQLYISFRSWWSVSSEGVNF